ncbi:tetratricopeptide repeat protein [Cognatishimia sp. F0-27]|uniref:tetratricopeptide repeat protein n=1 Tax=Cognatishimia sp. F0-27 TaxID=2816855 RepID=UPI001D0CC181|nr:tetratricopeptide repeat protein [Cognatishimia sp. F0-27]MCC1494084.1 tetratricopeptide repeat protein [Cognatishimia sp. F0-27]
MSTRHRSFKSTVTALLAVVGFSIPVTGWAEDRAADLLRQLGEAENAAAAQRLERQVIDAWGKSGSASMDLLLKRGHDALAVRDHAAATEHFRALTDHAPAFAEGWHGLALAYFQAERFGPAMDALERTLTLNPQHFAAMRGIGAIHERVDRPVLAYEAYARALALRPHDEDVEKAMERLERVALGIRL